jgi:sugar diacid utilization regulator
MFFAGSFQIFPKSPPRPLPAAKREQAQTMMRELAFSNSMKPREYERFCAGLLREAGWDARVTTHRRDFGVDVIAEKPDRRIVVQCKLYSSPVGLKAVQEIVAGKIHEQANCAVVVSESRVLLSRARVPCCIEIARTGSVQVEALHNRTKRVRTKIGESAAKPDNVSMTKLDIRVPVPIGGSFRETTRLPRVCLDSA